MSLRFLSFACFASIAVACSAPAEPEPSAPEVKPSASVTAPANQATPPAGTFTTSPAYAADAKLHGRDLRAIGARYWTWYTSIAREEHPALDHACDVDQDADVFYLAGSMVDGSVRHECSLPAGRAVFVPIVGALARSCPENDGCSTPRDSASLLRAAETALDPTSVAIEIDGAPLADDSIAHIENRGLQLWGPREDKDQIFSCIGPLAANECGIPAGPRPAGADMYAALLRPLSAGKHVVHASATLRSGEHVEVTWSLDVK